MSLGQNVSSIWNKMLHPVADIQKTAGNEGLAASPSRFLLPESPVMGTLLGPELQALDPSLRGF